MNRDSPILSDFIWYPADEDAPPLQYPSVFLDPIWQENYYEIDDPIGLVQTDNIKNNWVKPKPMLKHDHVCGQEADFHFGGGYFPDYPPVVYMPNGLPECCTKVPDAGGIGMGGHVIAEYIPPIPPFNPGTTCATAALADVDAYYEWVTPTAGSYWIKLNRAPGAGGWYLLVQEEKDVSPGSTLIWGGSACGSLIFYSSNLNQYVYFFALDPGDVGFFQVQTFGTNTKVHFSVTTTYPTQTAFVHGGIGAGGKAGP